ncbi:MAG: hypothetical protein WC758_06300 [Candidatus Woesearchaeota archaeon]|jgi:hypothetical protein
MTKNAEDNSLSQNEGDKELAIIEKNGFLVKNKIFLDKVGAGFSSIQVLNILFYFTGASFFLIGIINAIRSSLANVTSYVVRNELSKGKFSKKIMVYSGIFFGFTYLFIALGVSLGLKWIFALSLLLGSVFFTIHSDLFQTFTEKYLRRIKSNVLTEKWTMIGLFVTLVTIFLSTYIIDSVPFSGKIFVFPLIGAAPYYGYLISFEFAAFAFILSSYFLMKLKLEFISSTTEDANSKNYFKEIFYGGSTFFKNKYLSMLMFATIFLGAFQAIINSFLGIYIYTEFFDSYLGGFLNVGLMIAFALVVVLIGSKIASKMNKNMGVAPLFVFGTLLMAILPLTIVFNPYFPAIIAANMLSVLGAAMIGSGHNLVTARLLNEKDRETYYMYSGLIAIIPFILFTAILSFIAQRAGIVEVFRYAGFGLIVCLVPIYFSIVVWISKKN